MSPRWMPVLALLCCTLPSAARAQNPKLNLRLDQVNLVEALEALNKATGIPVSLYRPRLPPNFPVPPLNARYQEKASFNWEGVTFAGALRELSERYQLQPMRRAGMYELYPGTPPPKLPEKLTGLVELDGLRLFVRGLIINENRNRGLNFVAENHPPRDNALLTLTLGGLLTERDPATFAGVENVVAMDDRGHRLGAVRDLTFYESTDSGVFPDEWTVNLIFQAPDARAQRIASLQGDVMIYKSARYRKVEVPLPLPEKVVRREVGAAQVIFSAYRELPPPDPEEEMLEIPGIPPGARFHGRPPVQGPVVRVRVASPSEPNSSRHSAREAPVVVGASGRLYPGAPLGGSSGYGAGAVRVSDAVYYFPNLEERAVRIVWETYEKGEKVKLAGFRMTNIPLPPIPPGEPVAPPPAGGGEAKPPPKGEPLPEHPWAFRGGATLIARVERQGKPVDGGMLQLGMARVGAGKPGPIRWAELPVDGQGRVRLWQVQPGTFQVHLKYRHPSIQRAGAGRWENSTATITLKAGQESVLPPLRWVAGAASK